MELWSPPSNFEQGRREEGCPPLCDTPSQLHHSTTPSAWEFENDFFFLNSSSQVPVTELKEHMTQRKEAQCPVQLPCAHEPAE